MANRPLFIPTRNGSPWVYIKEVAFFWHSGFSKAQKEKNRVAMHAAATTAGFKYVLEISSKSNLPIGVDLSAFNLLTPVLGHGEIPVECAFQGSKVYAGCGSSEDLYGVDPRTAKREATLRNREDLLLFQFEGRRWPLTPKTLFYDWVYLSALVNLPKSTLDQITSFEAFTDIEFNPAKSINCQARSCALAVSLIRSGLFEIAMESAESYRSIIQGDAPGPTTIRQGQLL